MLTFPASIASDADLARGAQAGDSASLALLLERHRAALHAHALRLVGHDHAQDAVQDTFLLALRKIGQLRDPEAVVGWLHTALRSLCLTRLRRDHGELPLHELEPPAPKRESPEAQIERLALRDWVWTAIGRLSEPLRIVAMLRYFGSYNSYEEIASICGVPVGTVRSRLNQVKLKLADQIMETAEAAHDAVAARTQQKMETLTAFGAAGDHESFLAPMAEDVQVVYAAGGSSFIGRTMLAEGIAQDTDDGVTFLPTKVVCGPGITIVEARFINPVTDPFHCPPETSQVHLHRGGETFRVLLHFADRKGSLEYTPDALAEPLE